MPLDCAPDGNGVAGALMALTRSGFRARRAAGTAKSRTDRIKLFSILPCLVFVVADKELPSRAHDPRPAVDRQTANLDFFDIINNDNYAVHGGGGIRTPETLSSLTVFKTVAFSHSATPPC